MTFRGRFILLFSLFFLYTAHEVISIAPHTQEVAPEADSNDNTSHATAVPAGLLAAALEQLGRSLSVPFSRLAKEIAVNIIPLTTLSPKP